MGNRMGKRVLGNILLGFYVYIAYVFRVLLLHCLDRDPEHPFLAPEQPFQDVGKENRREVGAYFV